MNIFIWYKCSFLRGQLERTFQSLLAGSLYNLIGYVAQANKSVSDILSGLCFLGIKVNMF